jgi:hypothetical protein
MCLLGEEGLWSGETLPSLSLVVDEGGVGGSENPGNIKQITFHKYCFGNCTFHSELLKHTKCKAERQCGPSQWPRDKTYTVLYHSNIDIMGSCPM